METITLKHTFKSPDTGNEIAAVELRSPTAGDKRLALKIKDANPAQLTDFVVRRCILNLSPAEIDAIHLADYTAIETVLNAEAGGANFPQATSGEAIS